PPPPPSSPPLPYTTLFRSQRACAGAALKACDGDVVGTRFRNARRDRADADFGHQFYGHLAVRIDVLQVVDQLRQILDRIDVVMRDRKSTRLNSSHVAISYA